MATRIHLLPASEIQQSLEWLRSAVEKTGDQPEQELFEMLCRYALNQDGRSV